MPLTTVGFYESQDPASAFVPIAALADQHIRVVGDDIQIPTLSQIAMIAGGASLASVLARMRLTSPSLREKGLFQISPIANAATPVEPETAHTLVDLRHAPLKLVVGEQLNAEVLTPTTGGVSWLIAWLVDAPIVPVAGDIFTIQVTAGTALTAGIWNNRALAFTEDLPRGRYQVVGMRPEGAGMIAARLVFVGTGWRPGALGSDAPNDYGSDYFRYGNMGIFGEFEDIEPPTVDILSVSADTAEYIYLDLIQIRKGPA